MMDVVLILLGLLMGGALGALGGGGSILAVPMLVYIAGEAVKVGTTASLVAVGAAAFAGAIGHFFGGRVKVKQGLIFGVVGVGGSLLGSSLNRIAPPNVLLLLFALFMLFVATRMVLAKGAAPRQAQALSVDGALSAELEASKSTSSKVIRVILAGSIVGFLTGFFGVGGGFVIVPALVLALDFSMPDAIGTSLLVISVNSVIALAARMGHTNVPWGVVLIFSAGALVGSLIGSKAAGKFKAEALKRAFVILIFVLAIYMGVDAIVRMVH